MTKEELRSAIMETAPKTLEQNICEVSKILTSNYKTGFEFGFKTGLRLSVDMACNLLRSMTEDRIGDRFIDDFRNLMEKEICEK